MTEEQFLAALAAIPDQNVRSILLYYHGRFGSLEDDQRVVRKTVAVIRWGVPFVAGAVGMLIGALR